MGISLFHDIDHYFFAAVCSQIPTGLLFKMKEMEEMHQWAPHHPTLRVISS